MDRRQRAEAAVARCLEGEEAGWAQAIEAACAGEPDIAAEIRAIFSALGSAGLANRPMPQRVGMFELLGALGEGGMGDVFRARDIQLGREVAVKIVRSDLRLQPDAFERFEREMRTVAGIHHPGIVRLLSTGIEEGVPYYAMDLIDGLTLAEVIRRLRASEPGRLTGGDLAGVLGVDRGVFPGAWVETCFRIVAKVARALHHAHGAAVLHRDVKPANIMLTRTGEPVLIDFGLARQKHDLQLTRQGARLGSLPYLAPELWKSPNGHGVKTEVYSLGLVLWEMLALRPAFAGESEEALRTAVLHGSLPRLRLLQPALSRDAEIVCTSAIDPEPGRRHVDCGAFASDLESVLALRPIAARARGPVGRLVLLARRRPVAAALVGLCLLAVALLATVQSVRATAEAAARDFAMRDRRTSAEWAIDALTFLQSMGERNTFPLRPASKPYLELWRAQAKEVLEYLLKAEARGAAEAPRYVRPMPGLQPAENGASFFVPLDHDLDRDHAAFLTERSVTIAIRTLLRGVSGDNRFVAIAESIARDSVESAEARAAWRVAAQQSASSPLYSGLELRPQFGFLPIGTDEATGRLLFWHVATGVRPDVRAGRESHRDADAGLVFELMPAAEGVQRPFLLARQPMSCACGQSSASGFQSSVGTTRGRSPTFRSTTVEWSCRGSPCVCRPRRNGAPATVVSTVPRGFSNGPPPTPRRSWGLR